MRSENWFTLKIRLSFNSHKVIFTYILHITFNSLTLKKNEYEDIKCLSENTSFCWLLSEQQSSDRQQNNKDHSDTTRSHREIHILSKIIKLCKKLLKQNCFKVVTESKWLQIVWKMQNTLKAWNDYLKHNDYKNKIIKEVKYLHFRA